MVRRYGIRTKWNLRCAQSAIFKICACIVCLEIVCATTVSSVKMEQGAEVVMVDSNFKPHRVYHLEDFFWTGSGDGKEEEHVDGTENSDPSKTLTSGPTVFLTTTIVSTMIISPATMTVQYGTESTQTTTTCTHKGCIEEPLSPSGHILPTPTFPINGTETTEDDENEIPYETPDRRYWLLTVLQSSKDDEPSISDLQEKLATLYQVAFYRQQERHLGIKPYFNHTRFKRSSAENLTSYQFMNTTTLFENEIKSLNPISESFPYTTNQSTYSISTSTSSDLLTPQLSDEASMSDFSKSPIQIQIPLPTDSWILTSKETSVKRSSKSPVKVQIHNVTRSSGRPQDSKVLELVYSVHVAGQPVPARTAAADMALVSDAEVVKALGGHSVRTKAEPYIKEDKTVYLGLVHSENKWLFVAAAIVTICILIILLILLVIGIKSRASNKLIDSPRTRTEPIPEMRTDRTNIAQQQHTDAEVQTVGRISSFLSTTNIAKPYIRKLQPVLTSSASTSCTSTSSSEPSPATSLKSRELINWKNEQRISIQNKYRIVPHNVKMKYDSKSDDKYIEVTDATNSNVVVRKSTDVKSANSYLSMPSVKCFPRGNMPEPLSRVLEPVTVRHLDEGTISPSHNTPVKTQKHIFVRHGSIDAEDPGVLGPLVWNQHCQRLQHVVAVEKEEPDEVANVGKMRKRFQELLDDAFSLFGSRSGSPAQEDSNTPQAKRKFDARIHSAHPRLPSDSTTNKDLAAQTRPKTSGPRNTESSHLDGPPRRAWGSGAPSPLVRPLSAGPFHRPSLAPHVCPERILVDSKLAPDDPATTVISSIKTELQNLSGTSQSKK